MKIDGAAAVVTGGTKGIGYGIAERLVQAGASVMICGRDRDELTAAVDKLSASGKAFGKLCDVRVEEQVKGLIDSAVKNMGGIDVLVNNAGMGYFGKTVEKTTPDEFRQTIETNLNGVYYCCHYGLPHMKERGGGYILNISSLAGQNPHAGMAAYNASKYALNGFSEALMLEVRHDNIKVSYICPGSVNTSFGGDSPSDDKAWQLQPADIAQVVVDLLEMNERALPSKIELRPTRPPKR